MPVHLASSHEAKPGPRTTAWFNPDTSQHITGKSSLIKVSVASAHERHSNFWFQGFQGPPMRMVSPVRSRVEGWHYMRHQSIMESTAMRERHSAGSHRALLQGCPLRRRGQALRADTQTTTPTSCRAWQTLYHLPRVIARAAARPSAEVRFRAGSALVQAVAGHVGQRALHGGRGQVVHADAQTTESTASKGLTTPLATPYMSSRAPPPARAQR